MSQKTRKIEKTKTGSSETLRETTPIGEKEERTGAWIAHVPPMEFKEFRKILPQHKKDCTQSFLEWFVGFSEGQGSWIGTGQKGQIFMINQKSIKVLYHIRTNLGFGRVIPYESFGRYMVTDKMGILRLQKLFNGNLHLHKTHKDFVDWCHGTPGKVFTVKEPFIPTPISLGKNSWLSGFIDAQGTFNVQKTKDKGLQLRFTLDVFYSESTLPIIRNFLGGGSIDPRPLEEEQLVWRLTTLSLKTHPILLSYLHKHPLRTEKQIDRKRWSSLMGYMERRTTIPWTGKVILRVLNLLHKLGLNEE